MEAQKYGFFEANFTELAGGANTFPMVQFHAPFRRRQRGAAQRLRGIRPRLSFCGDNRFMNRITLHYIELTGYWRNTT
jgi:hypothetical protein